MAALSASVASAGPRPASVRMDVQAGLGQLPELTEAGLHVGQRQFQEEPGPVVRFGVGASVYEPEKDGRYGR